MRRPIRGLLIGPMVAPIAYWAGVTVDAWRRDFRVFNELQALREFLTIVAFGLPIAYAVTLVWGAPVMYVLHRLGWLRASTLIVAGALGGIIVGVWFAVVQQGVMFTVKMPLLGAAAIGALSGAACWWVGRGTDRT